MSAYKSDFLNILTERGFIHQLSEPDALDALKALILPLATLVTPNLPEAGALAGFEVATREDMPKAAEAIQDVTPEQLAANREMVRDLKRNPWKFFWKE